MPKMVWTRMTAWMRAENSEIAGDHHQRIEHHLIGNERAKDQDGKEDFRALELPVDQRVAVHRGDARGNDHGRGSGS